MYFTYTSIYKNRKRKAETSQKTDLRWTFGNGWQAGSANTLDGSMATYKPAILQSFQVAVTTDYEDPGMSGAKSISISAPRGLSWLWR